MNNNEHKQTSQTRRFWFQLVDEKGDCFKGSMSCTIDFDTRGDAIAFCTSLILTFGYGVIFRGIVPFQLRLYKNRTAFDSGNGKPLEEDEIIGDYGKTKKDALIVLVPSFAGVIGNVISEQQPFHDKNSRILNEKLSESLKALTQAIANNGWLESTHDLPDPSGVFKKKKLFLRTCYAEMFNLLLANKCIKEKFAISGTPGIGKSLFFFYMLWRFVQPDESWKPKNILYQLESYFFFIDIEKKEFYDVSKAFARHFVKASDVYIIDGEVRKLLPHSGLTLFISSPCSRRYRKYVTHQDPMKFCFPIWMRDELEECRMLCYPHVSQDALQATYDVYGGVARAIFGVSLKPNQLVCMLAMDNALESTSAVDDINIFFDITAIHNDSNTLLHCISGNLGGLDYQFLEATMASKYVTKQLWKRYYNAMLDKMQHFFNTARNDLSRCLFEGYVDLILQSGNVVLPCRNLKTGKIEPNFSLASRFVDIRSLKKSDLPGVFEEGVYYEGCDDILAIDAVIPQVGLVQATASLIHPIKGIRTLNSICKIFTNQAQQELSPSGNGSRKKLKQIDESDVKFYFVVPKTNFQKFTEQQCLTANRKTPELPPKIQQYALELDFGISTPIWACQNINADHL
jgi:hypothetical protein